MINNEFLKKFEGGSAKIEIFQKNKKELISGIIKKAKVECLAVKLFLFEERKCKNYPNHPEEWVKANSREYYQINFETADIFERKNSIAFESYQQGINIVLSSPKV